MKTMMGNKGLAQLWMLVGLVVMAVALPVASVLVSKNQDNRNKAAGNSVCYPSNGTTVCYYPTDVPASPTPTAWPSTKDCSLPGSCGAGYYCVTSGTADRPSYSCIKGVSPTANLFPTATPTNATGCTCSLATGWKFIGTCPGAGTSCLTPTPTKVVVTPTAVMGGGGGGSAGGGVAIPPQGRICSQGDIAWNKCQAKAGSGGVVYDNACPGGYTDKGKVFTWVYKGTVAGKVFGDCITKKCCVSNDVTESQKLDACNKIKYTVNTTNKLGEVTINGVVIKPGGKHSFSASGWLCDSSKTDGSCAKSAVVGIPDINSKEVTVTNSKQCKVGKTYSGYCCPRF